MISAPIIIINSPPPKTPLGLLCMAIAWSLLCVFLTVCMARIVYEDVRDGRSIPWFAVVGFVLFGALLAVFVAAGIAGYSAL